MSESESLIGAINFWHWFILGGLLVMVEVFAPGAYFLWLGMAAAETGAVLLVATGLSWEFQFLIFAVLAVANVVMARVLMRKHPLATDRPGLNLRGREFIGRTLVLDKPIVGGAGRAKLGDSTWKISATEDLPAGASVRVVDIDGIVLKVERS